MYHLNLDTPPFSEFEHQGSSVMDTVVSCPLDLDAAMKVLCYKHDIETFSITAVDTENGTITFIDDKTRVDYVLNVAAARDNYALNKTFLLLCQEDDETLSAFIVNQIVKMEGSPNGAIGFTFKPNINTFMQDDNDFCKLWIDTTSRLMQEILALIASRSAMGIGEWVSP